MQAYEWMRAVIGAAKKMPFYEEELCVLDTVIGDGDHGITISRGYTRVVADMDIAENIDIKNFCMQYAAVISNAMGGAIGPIYGAIWKTFGREMQGKLHINTKDFGLALQAAATQVQRIGNVNQGDKTILDAILPAVEALLGVGNMPFEVAICLAAKAALEGSENTKDMVARKGRARYLPEKSVGHIDAGSRSFAIWMNELANCIVNEEEK